MTPFERTYLCSSTFRSALSSSLTSWSIARVLSSRATAGSLDVSGLAMAARIAAAEGVGPIFTSGSAPSKALSSAAGETGVINAARLLLLDLLARARDREALAVKQLLDPDHRLDVAAPVDPLAGAVLGGRQGRELGLPVSQHVRLDVRELADLADLEEQLVRNLAVGHVPSDFASDIRRRLAERVRPLQPGEKT